MPEGNETLYYRLAVHGDEDEAGSCSMSDLEVLLKYEFRSKGLLREALAHPSSTDSASYQRLEFLGDAALGLAFSSYAFLAYPELDPGQLSLLRSANISTEKLARVAVRHGLYRFVRRNAPALDEKVIEFSMAVQQEDEPVVYGGSVKAPKILADVVESVAAAVYIDSGFDLERLWEIFRDLLEPILTFDLLQKQPQPVTKLYQLCQKDGKHVVIKPERKGEKNVASVYVDGEFIVSASSEQRENAKLHAAKAALEKLSFSKIIDTMDIDVCELNDADEIEGAKQKLHELCGKKKWPKPSYRVVKEAGPGHDRRFLCSVQIERVEDIISIMGDEKSRVKDAENSAASMMLLSLLVSKSI